MRGKRLFSWGMVLSPLLVALIVLPMLPNEIPMHFGFDGDITRYGSRYEMLIVPAISIVFGLFWLLVERAVIKQDKEKGVRNAKVLYWCNIVFALIFLVLTIQTAYIGYNDIQNITDGIDVMRIVTVCLGISFIVLGNLLPKCKQNTIIGIRTKWTLVNETSWHKTHRLGGRVMLVYGIVMTLLSLFVLNGIANFLVIAIGLIVLTIALAVYSHHIYKQEVISK